MGLEKLAEELGQALHERSMTLVTAESCTGGGLSYWITSIPGSSNWFDRGSVTYSQQAKMDMLGVPKEILDKHGAVSEKTARAMAEGALKHSRADVSIAVTGIAGPDGGSIDKPVGTVWIAFAGNHFDTVAKVNLYTGSRLEIRTATIKDALSQCLMLIKNT